MNSGRVTTFSAALNDVMPIDFPVSKEVVPFLLIIFIALSILALLFMWTRKGGGSKHAVTPDRSEDSISVARQPFLTKQEATLYNMIQLAVQDNYLVFVKIPLSRLVSLSGKSGEHRKATVRAIRSLTADVVLVHPGTLLPVQVITLKENSLEENSGYDPGRFRSQILRSAEIEEVQLDPHAKYDVPQLIELVGLKEEE